MAEYTLFDQFGNCNRVELSIEPLIVQRCYVLGHYEEEFVGKTNQEAVAKMEEWCRHNTPYRGQDMIAKHLGYYDLFIDDQGRRFLHGFYDGKGKFQFASDALK